MADGITMTTETTRKRVGRPRKRDGEHLETLTARLPQPVLRKIEALAVAKGTTRSRIVQSLLTSAVRRAK